MPFATSPIVGAAWAKPVPEGTVSAPLIVCDRVSVAFGRHEVLHEVSLAIEAGGMVPFIGSNGAGKTTLLRTILGLVRPRSGRVVTPFDRSPPGYVSQTKVIDPLYPVSARQIVEMGFYPALGWWRRPDAALRQRYDEAVARLGLAPHLDKNFGELSGGTRQKVLITRALVSGAEILVMDEPTSELDEEAERAVIELLAALCRERGHTVLLALHGWSRIRADVRTVCLVEHGRARLLERGDAAFEPVAGGPLG